MPDILWNDVIAHAPETSAVSNAARIDILAYVNAVIAEEFFGAERARIVKIYLAAHLGTSGPLSGGSASSGAVISESAGGLSRSYGQSAPTSGDASLDTTSYGRAYSALVRSSAARVPFVAF